MDDDLDVYGYNFEVNASATHCSKRWWKSASPMVDAWKWATTIIVITDTDVYITIGNFCFHNLQKKVGDVPVDA